MRIRLLIFVLLLVLAGGFAFTRVGRATTYQSAPTLDEEGSSSLQSQSGPVLRLPDGTVQLEIADTLAERVQGLSGRASLPPNTALLFVFGSSDYQGIWMKDMLFPIDIIWLDSNYRVVDIAPNVSPDTYPQIFRPREVARYVIETPAGFSVAHKITIGDVLDVVL